MRHILLPVLRFIVGLILLAAITAAAMFVGNLIWSLTHSEVLSGLGFMGAPVAIIIGAGQIRL